MSTIRIAGMFDMRNPDFGTPRRELYAAALDMIAFADEIGVPRINLMEHHSSDEHWVCLIGRLARYHAGCKWPNDEERIYWKYPSRHRFFHV